jgi:non-specific serine/threonine protein kinase
VLGLLASTRALTVVGPAGAERTALVGRVATDALAEFPDGVWLVEVAPLSTETQLERAVAAVVGVSATAHGESLSAIAQYLRGKRVLVVLDGCDHLAEACASFAAELAAHWTAHHRPGGAATEVDSEYLEVVAIRR